MTSMITGDLYSSYICAMQMMLYIQGICSKIIKVGPCLECNLQYLNMSGKKPLSQLEHIVLCRIIFIY